MPRTPTAQVNGATIRDIRGLVGMTTRELAQRATTTSQHISNVELGTRPCSAALAGRIAVALGVRLESILREPLAATAERRSRPRCRERAAA